ncbi:10147_t:CDS:2, partial [Funneliformis geosporum]
SKTTLPLQFYQSLVKPTKPVELSLTPPTKPDDCLQDAQNCAEPLKVKIEKVPSTIKISLLAETVEPTFPNYDLMEEWKAEVPDIKPSLLTWLNTSASPSTSVRSMLNMVSKTKKELIAFISTYMNT